MITSNVECKKALFQKSVEQLTHTEACIHYTACQKKIKNISSDIVGPEKCFWGSEPFSHTHSATISSYSTRDAKYYQ